MNQDWQKTMQAQVFLTYSKINCWLVRARKQCAAVTSL